MLRSLKKPAGKKNNSHINFSLHSLIIQDHSIEQDYKKRSETSVRIYVNDLKLLSSELVFINRFWDPKKIPKPILLYVGASPGKHLINLCMMYPQFEYHFYGDKKFDSELLEFINDVAPGHKISITVSKKFKHEDIEKFKSYSDRLFFISNIKNKNIKDGITIKYAGDQKEEFEKEKEHLTELDMAIQRNWVKSLEPEFSMLKFRPPHWYENSLTEDYEYFDGLIFAQLYNDYKKTETRMVVTKKDIDSTKVYSTKKYDRQLNYYNFSLREQNCNNPVTKDETNISPDDGLFLYFDQVGLFFVFKEYLTKFSEDKPSMDELLRLYNCVLNYFMDM